jgi:acyl-CoA synthetase (AMP-forming)/AMP-acid ligase II/acyl carrier protein
MSVTLVELMRARAAENADKPLFTFLKDGDEKTETLSYAEVDARARGVAAMLVRESLAGKPVVLLYPPGLEYICAFLGCLYASVIAVPAYPPNPARLERTLPRLRRLVENAEAPALLTTSTLRDASRAFAELAPELAAKRWLASDDAAAADAAEWHAPAITQETVALVQYTSGSTGTPKGVVLTHANLLHNQKLIASAFHHDASLVGVGWLPLYHDMGLIGNVLGTIWGAGRCVLLSPLDFLVSPVRWLRAISRYRGTTSGGPNFAYEMCTQKVTPEQRETLDLGSWKVAFNGSEPVRAQTLERFHKTFAPRGFRWESFLPCYGLAEASLIVSGELGATGPTITSFDVAKLEIGNRAVPARDGDADGRRLVGCGPIAGDLDVRIVDPATRAAVDDAIGEIWISGGSVGQGYWNDEDTTRETFRATISGVPNTMFLRTGDLGFKDPKGQLFIVGRIKDVLIVRGRNYYPHDLERTAEAAHPALRSGCSAAFSVDEAGDVGVVLLAEYDAKRGPGEEAMEAAARAIREAVGDEHELRTQTVVFLKAGQIPKTSSGKVMRSAAQRAWREGKLEVVHTSTEAAVGAKGDLAERAPVQRATEQEIVGFIIEWFANPAIDASAVEKSLDALGLDSAGAVRLASSLSRWLGRKVPPTVFWDYPTIASLAKHLSGAD